MKNGLMSLVVAVLTIASVQAQENKTMKKESTVERVVTKEGSNVSVKEIKNTTTERGSIMAEKSDKTNQEFNESTSKIKNSEIIVDEVNVDQKNEVLVRQEKDKLMSDLEASKRQREQVEASKRQKEELAAQKRQQEELDAQKKQFREKSRSKLRRKLMKEDPR